MNRVNGKVLFIDLYLFLPCTMKLLKTKLKADLQEVPTELIYKQRI